MSDPRRHIPPVDRLVGHDAFRELRERFPRHRVVGALRAVVRHVREEVADGVFSGDPAEVEPYALRVERRLEKDERPSLRPVVNATGVVLHTNLGRAPLAPSVREAMARAATGYSNLEYDLEAGERGSRYVHCADLLRELTGAEDALVVNNNAAAVVLALNTLARARGVPVSRGELVEIGGGFRIPEMLERAGARLVEVGTTNRTRVDDYREAVAAGDVAAVLKVHRSNFRVDGFTEEASVAELAALTREHELPLIHDLGSGLLADPEALGLPPEPRPADSLDAGADVVAFSGDKLLGGPQAGILVGGGRWIDAMRRNPLCRALRVDKVTLAALEATLRLYRDPARALEEVPGLAALARTPEELEPRARRLAAAAREAGLAAGVVRGTSVVGGGTYPGVELPTWTVRVESAHRGATALAGALRAGEPAVVGRVEDEAVVLDLRTVAEEEDEVLAARLRGLERGAGGDGGVGAGGPDG